MVLFVSGLAMWLLFLLALLGWGACAMCGAVDDFEEMDEEDLGYEDPTLEAARPITIEPGLYQNVKVEGNTWL